LLCINAAFAAQRSMWLLVRELQQHAQARGGTAAMDGQSGQQAQASAHLQVHG
jgi:hypothetical protein